MSCRIVHTRVLPGGRNGASKTHVAVDTPGWPAVTGATLLPTETYRALVGAAEFLSLASRTIRMEGWSEYTARMQGEALQRMADAIALLREADTGEGRRG